MDSLTKWHSSENDDDDDDGRRRGHIELSVDGMGTGPMPGQLFRNPSMARVLRSLGEYGAKEGFYRGFPASSIVESVRRHGGCMTLDDMSNHVSTFPEPICVEYRGMNLWEVPPNGQGVAGLIALRGLNVLERSGRISGTTHSRPSHPSSTHTHTYTSENCNNDCRSVSSSSLSSSSSIKEGLSSTIHGRPQPSCEMLHAQIEMMRLGFDDARSYVCDLEYANQEECTTGWLLKEERIATRAMGLFDVDKAVMQGRPDSTSCTVSFQVVDGEGNAMSFVNRYVFQFSGEIALILF